MRRHPSAASWLNCGDDAFLGPGNCAPSVVEGRSDDGTYEVLKLLGKAMGTIGAQYFFTTNEVDPTAEGVGRIQDLAELRNQALWPLRGHGEEFSVNSTVVFINDVAICMEDILELIHQRLYQNADMTCAMDWTYVGLDPTFYDVWIARGMNGDTFFNIPEVVTGILPGTSSGTIRMLKNHSRLRGHSKSSRVGTVRSLSPRSPCSNRRLSSAALTRTNAHRVSHFL